MVETMTAERLSTEIEQLIALATAVLNEHTNDHGLCAVCGCAFPCPRAVLAEHNLALRSALSELNTATVTFSAALFAGELDRETHIEMALLLIHGADQVLRHLAESDAT